MENLKQENERLKGIIEKALQDITRIVALDHTEMLFRLGMVAYNLGGKYQEGPKEETVTAVNGLGEDELLNRINKALAIAQDSGAVDGSHHKMWTIDQMVRALTGCPMVKRTALAPKGYQYDYEVMGESKVYMDIFGNDSAWDRGIAP